MREQVLWEEEKKNTHANETEWVMMIMEDGRGLGRWARHHGQSSVVCNQPENGALELASRLQQVVRCWIEGIGAEMFRRVTVEGMLV